MAKRRKGKLELDWVGKGDIILTKFDEKGKTYPASYFQGQVSDEELMPREFELIESVGDPKSENMLIWGENLIALRSLEREFAGKIKLIYIDPPFNTGQDFEDYEDGLEHSIWLSMMQNRLELLRNLLSKDGLIFVHIDDIEQGYLRLLLDEVFDRRNYLSLISWERSPGAGIGQGGKFLINVSEYIYVYAKNWEAISRVKPTYKREIPLKNMKQYNRILVDKGRKELIKEFPSKSNNLPVKVYKRYDYEISNISLKDFENRKDEIVQEYVNNFENIFRTNRVQKENRFQQDLISNMDKDLYSVQYTPSRGRTEGQITELFYYRQELFSWLKDVAEIQGNALVKIDKINDFWTKEQLTSAGISGEGNVELRRGKKPEVLLDRIISMVTRKGDWVLDCFGGSATTTAAAHKLGRKWIMVEVREDMVKEKALKRMRNVVNGDTTGISKEVNWKGGGGFKVYKLGEPLIVKHKDYPSIKIINPKYYNTALIKVICNVEGFKFRKNDKLLHGVNKLGNKYAHVTEQYVSQGYIDLLKNKLADNEQMIIYCFNYDEKITLPFNMIIKKLPTDIGKAFQLRLQL